MIRQTKTTADLILAMILFIIAALAISWVVVAKPTGWLKLFLILCSVIFGFFGTLALLFWISKAYAYSLFLINDARTWALIKSANALEPLRDKALEIVGRYETLPIEGIMGASGRIMWNVRAPLGSVPLDAFQDFLEMSSETQPFTWPVREHTKFGQKYEWTNAEWLLRNMTHAIVSAGWAEPAEGNNSARLIFPYEEVCRQFGMEVSHGSS